MFFGNAFFQEGPNRRYVYRWEWIIVSVFIIFRTQRGGGGAEGHDHRGQRQQRNTGSFKFLPLLQFLPLLIIIISSFALNFQSDVFLFSFSSLTSKEPSYSLTRTYKFNIERNTINLKIPYFVDQSFHSSIGQNRKKLINVRYFCCWRYKL